MVIAVVDYGRGNLKSVATALAHLGVAVTVARRPSDLTGAAAVILPGVGAFADAATTLTQAGLTAALQDYAAQGRPFLGICLGLQLLFGVSEEDTSAAPGQGRGLSLLPGRVTRLPSAPRLPHIGWNRVTRVRPSRLLTGPSGYYYFAHSYAVSAGRANDVKAEVSYGSVFPALVEQANIFGVQFHPERSGPAGLDFLWQFARLAGEVGSRPCW